MVFLLARLLLPESPRVALLAAWIFALGGLHVTQSHFFLADTPALFWTFLGLYLLGRSAKGVTPVTDHYFNAAAVALGIALGMKLAVQGLPSLTFAVLRCPSGHSS